MGERDPVPTWYFALVLVRKGRRFLLVHEAKHGQEWYLPAGRVEPGESLMEGARRETLEESGVPVELEGILRLQHTPRLEGTARVRVIFVARPADDTPPKSEPDEESLEAGWFSLQEAAQLPLRGGGHEVLGLLGEVLAGAPIYPLSVLGPES
jgi:ADP-ribose pyrophosphatase YjhB (NUDIX family)